MRYPGCQRTRLSGILDGGPGGTAASDGGDGAAGPDEAAGADERGDADDADDADERDEALDDVGLAGRRRGAPGVP
jgi:hypothetical protein